MSEQYADLPLDPDLPLEPRPTPAGRPVPLHLTPSALGLVALGGMAGTGARYGVGRLLPAVGGWPLAIVVVNVVGAFVLGVLLEALARRGPDAGVRRRLRLALGTGFCGAFTTYSALAVDTALLLGEGRAVLGLAYALSSVVVGFAASFLGIWAAATRHRRTHPGEG